MDAENDDSHKAEIEPLFGTGNLSLHDGEGDSNIKNNKERTIDVEQPSGKPASYGAVSTEQSDDEDEDEHEVEHTVITTATSASGGSSKVSSKAGNKKKQPKKVVRQIVITESGKPEMPRPNCLMATFHFVESLGVITCLALMASQVIPLVVVPFNELGVANVCLKVYIAVFCVLFVFIEWDAPFRFLRDASFLQTYVRIRRRDGRCVQRVCVVRSHVGASSSFNDSFSFTVFPWIFILLHWSFGFRGSLLRTSC